MGLGKMDKMEILYTIKKTKQGFTATCKNINVVTQGDTLDEVIKNLKEAIELHLEDLQ